jgi:hypothetical protein
MLLFLPIILHIEPQAENTLHDHVVYTRDFGYPEMRFGMQC